MELRKSERKNAKIKMALQAPSGAGKTYSSLLIAKGLTNEDFSKVAVIDTENGSADLYAHLGEYNVLSLKPPFSPESYIEAIDVCLNSDIEVIIIDSISHCWDFLIEYHASLPGNSFTNWSKITPRQKAFVNKMLQANTHIIATMRTKQDYVLNQKDGKFIPEKVGLKAVQRDGVDYEFTLVFDIDIKHFAKTSKDRTGLYSDKPEFIITSGVGKQIKEWCNSGTDLDAVKEEIQNCSTNEELNQLYQKHIAWKEILNSSFIEKQQELKTKQLSNLNNFSQNGTTSS
ncbi:AAA family ATPase [Winogradskyella luteola]|uniref:AAA family ATPase n=1 Tax=Winogradskyella luteola TaxID=2828330 RepID=A0A9X1F7V0_9FLAO|nr:AAA family ATPase [Winogradskyella luteola]MBV7268947.1 AAA family ATPase [Winogradskyella luteola]